MEITIKYNEKDEREINLGTAGKPKIIQVFFILVLMVGNYFIFGFFHQVCKNFHL